MADALPSGTAASNTSLHAAKRAKNDEFYTQLADIENELKHYKEHFRGKVVFCNCDDPDWSSFWVYFQEGFEHLGLAKLIATHYEQGSQTYKLEFDGRRSADGKPIVRQTDLEGDGDFRSTECVELLKQADIVVTNPPFSLFREYVSQLIEHKKKFVILGNNNAITYKEVFKLIRDNELWLGYGVNKTMEFRLAPDYARWSRVDAKGNKYGKVPAISWFTNLPHKKRNEELILFRSYAGNEHKYPKYDNYDAIEVSKVVDIPADYTGAMGVPITFLDKYNPEQFEIVGIDRQLIEELTGKVSRFFKGGAELYARIVIKRRVRA